MPVFDKNQLYELEILKQVGASPRLNNRMAAAKLGCSVKLAHELLRKMVERGWLHVRKLHARRWDYFLTPRGLAEKARITCEFLAFSKYFYQEARRASAMLCRRLTERGIREVAFIGSGDLAEIMYLGVCEWKLSLTDVYDHRGGEFFGHPVKPFSELADAAPLALVICVYDEHFPMIGPKLPPGLEKTEHMYWLFDQAYYDWKNAE